MLDCNLILVGYSGHGYALADVAQELGANLIGYSDKMAVAYNPYGLEYLGFEEASDFVGWQRNSAFIIGIGDNLIRQKIAELIETKQKEVKTIISNSASVSKYGRIGRGTFVNRNVSVNAFAEIGNHVILNTGCIIEHDCIIGNTVHIAPGAVLAGNVHVGDRTFIGANAVVRQGVKIGNDVIIGAGSVILNDIPSGEKVVGNPGKYM